MQLHLQRRAWARQLSTIRCCVGFKLSLEGLFRGLRIDALLILGGDAAWLGYVDAKMALNCFLRRLGGGLAQSRIDKPYRSYRALADEDG
jgi:hypothetical protein